MPYFPESTASSNVIGTRQRSARPGAVQLPVGFVFDYNTYFPWQVWQQADGGYKHNVDVRQMISANLFSSATNMYLSTAGSDANNGTTWALAKLTLAGAIATINTNAVPAILNVQRGIYYSSTTDMTRPTQPIAIIGVGGQAIFSASVSGGVGTWTLSSGSTVVYENTESGVGNVIDRINLTANGFMQPYTYASFPAGAGNAAITYLESHPGYWANVSGVVYQSRVDALQPTDANTLVIKNGADPLIKMTTSGDMYLENITTWGGAADDDGGWLLDGNATGVFAAKNSSVMFAGSRGATQISTRGVCVENIKACYLQNVTIFHITNDGYNAHEISAIEPITVLVDCHISDCGYGTLTANQCVTLHDGCKGIIIGASSTAVRAPLSAASMWIPSCGQ